MLGWGGLVLCFFLVDGFWGEGRGEGAIEEQPTRAASGRRDIEEGRFTKVDEQLQDLEAHDPFFPPDADTARALKVVPVHDDVDGEVEGDWDPGDGRLARQLRVAEEDGRAVMIAVEER